MVDSRAGARASGCPERALNARARGSWSLLHGVLILTFTLSILAFAASTSSAVIVQLPNGQFKSYQPLRNAPSGGAEVFDSLLSNLEYSGGPVMPSNTNYTVYWSPGGPGEYPAEYQEGVDRYLTDLAHDSGQDTNVDSVATQYNDISGDFANYSSTFGGRLEDTHAYLSLIHI